MTTSKAKKPAAAAKGAAAKSARKPAAKVAKGIAQGSPAIAITQLLEFADDRAFLLESLALLRPGSAIPRSS